ncbi:stage II sporulation protein M, partial [bacterium M00.F.Ca.ET.168.01.1.1]
GVTVMLLFAGLLEGIGRQTITSDVIRYSIGGGMLAFWISYFYLFRMVRHGDR